MDNDEQQSQPACCSQFLSPSEPVVSRAGTDRTLANDSRSPLVPGNVIDADDHASPLLPTGDDGQDNAE
jgi:hypothetical protein